jgi:TatD DNase family protein
MGAMSSTPDPVAVDPTPTAREARDEQGKRRDLAWPPAPEPLPLPVADNHTHMDIADGDRTLPPAELVARAAAVGVDRIVTIGCDLPAARYTAEIAGTLPGLRGGVAIHPNEARLHARGTDHDGNPMVGLDDAIAEIADLLRGEHMVVVGETGLDHFRTSRKDAAAMAAQRDAFRAHIALAKELDLPLQIHDRDAHQDVLDILDADGAPGRTVLHCFSGDADFARECVRRGFFLSFAGTVTFKNAASLREAAAATPLDHLLVETDAPFLTPAPFRGRPNASYQMPRTVRVLADVLGQDLEVVCRAVSRTTSRVYGDW